MQRETLNNLLCGNAQMVHDFMENYFEICFSCEQTFPDKMSYEKHSCPAASYICSCGAEFPEYKSMLEHSLSHKSGDKMPNLQTLIKRRSAEQGLLIMPRLSTLQEPSFTLKSKSQVPLQSAQISQMPLLPSSNSQVTSVRKSDFPALQVPSLLTGSSAPTVDLWTLYQPVVLVKAQRQFEKNKPYSCGKCKQTFTTKSSLVLHHSTHAKDQIFGCIGCGLLLSSKSVPALHECNSPGFLQKYKLVTARPTSKRKTDKANTNKSPGPAKFKGSPTLAVKPSKALPMKPPVNALTKMPKNPPQIFATSTSGSSNDLTCGVCHIVFATALLLQKHKCIKAREFVEMQRQQKRIGTSTKKVQLRPKINGNNKPGIPESNVKDMPVKVDGGLGGKLLSWNREMDSSDDCYIVETKASQQNLLRLSTT